ncbi:MAG: cadherin domain-containing protein [Bacteroidota bacterium]
MIHKKRLKNVLIALGIIASILGCSNDDNGGSTTPENNAPDIQDQSFTASEVIDDASIIGKVVATDPDGDALTFSIKTNSNSLFEITNGGDISLAASQSLDYETATSHTLSIDVTDGEATSNAQVTINVIDVNENQAPAFVAQSFTAQENVTGQGGQIGVLAATDPDGDTLTFTFADPTNVTAFELNSATGEITTANSTSGNLDFETTPQYVLAVIASDGELTTQADITINVTDFNDRPEASDQTFAVAEDIDNTVLIGQIVATDQDGDALTFTVDIDNDLKFDLSATGELRLRQNTSLDFETKTSHQVSVFISDGAETISRTITVNVTDVVETSVSTLAGATQGNANGTGSAARFNTPRGIVTLTNGDMFVVDSANKAIKRVTATGVVTTVVSDNSFGALQDIVMDNSGTFYVSDSGRHVIWELEPDGNSYIIGIIAGLEDTSGTANGNRANARFNTPSGLDIDDSGNIYVADKGNGNVRRITPSGDVTTLITQSASNTGPEDVAVGADGFVYFTDSNRHYIGQITNIGQITLIAGSPGFAGTTDGSRSNSRFNKATGIVASGSTLYITSVGNDNVRKIQLDNNNFNNIMVTTVAGAKDRTAGDADGDGSDARFRDPSGITIDASGNLFIGDSGNHRIRKIEFQ